MGNAGQYKSDSWVVVGEKSSTTQIIGVFTQPRPFSEAKVTLMRKLPLGMEFSEAMSTHLGHSSTLAVSGPM